MPIQLKEENNGKFFVVSVSGKLTKKDYIQLKPEFEQYIKQHEKLRVLYEMTDFHGWGWSALWAGSKFKIKHYADIKRMERCAMVGEKKWQYYMTMFCKPFTKTAMRYFDHADIAEARKWLSEA